MKTKWETKKLGEVGNIFSGNSINEKVKKTKYLNLKEGMSYVATKDVSYENEINYDNGVKIPEEELSKFRIAHKNSVFICAEGGSAGRKLAFNTQDVCFVNKLFVFEARKSVEPKFVYYFYQSDDFQKQFKSRMTGLIGGVSMSKFKEISISYPDSLETQKTIVKILDEVFDSISKSKENTEKNLKNAKELFESYLEEIFSNPKEGWEEKKLGEIIETLTDFVANGSFASLRENVRYNKEKDFALLVRLKDLRKNLRESSDNIYVTQSAYNFLKKSSLEGGEFLIANVGANIGDSYLMPKINYPATLGPNMFLVKFNKEVNLEFIQLISSFLIKPQILRSSQGAAQPKINKNQFRDIKIPLPPLQEQKTIVQKLDVLSSQVRQLEEIYRQKLKDLEELKKSMLQKAFSGELTKE